MTQKSPAAEIDFREISELDEMRAVERMQKEVWGVEDREIFPALAMRPMVEVGAVLIGAFAGKQLAGFVFGFPGVEHGETILHSDLLAVKPQFRSLGLGFRLKVAQREAALAKGFKRITWTFDPLQAVNAHLNFAKLGVTSDRYLVDYYGETTSFLHRTGSDRLWVSWELESEHVVSRLTNPKSDRVLAHIPRFLIVGEQNQPVAQPEVETTQFLMEIPGNMNEITEKDPALARDWRQQTRTLFLSAFARGYRVVDAMWAREKSCGIYKLQR